MDLHGSPTKPQLIAVFLHIYHRLWFLNQTWMYQGRLESIMFPDTYFYLALWVYRTGFLVCYTLWINCFVVCLHWRALSSFPWVWDAVMNESIDVHHDVPMCSHKSPSLCHLHVLSSALTNWSPHGVLMGVRSECGIPHWGVSGWEKCCFSSLES